MAPAREVAVPSATYLCSTTFHSFDGFDFDHLVPHTPFGSGIWLKYCEGTEEKSVDHHVLAIIFRYRCWVVAAGSGRCAHSTHIPWVER
jgi:hypothetical protein